MSWPPTQRPRVGGVRADYDKSAAAACRIAEKRLAQLGIAVTEVCSTRSMLWDGHLARAWAPQLIAARVELVNQLSPRGGKGVPTAGAIVATLLRSSTAAASDVIENEAAAGNGSAELFEGRAARCIGPASRRRTRTRSMPGGPHTRDDLELRLGDQVCEKALPATGESWSMAFGRCGWRRTSYCVPMAEIRCCCWTTYSPNSTPARRQALANVAADAEQVLVTAAVHDDIPGDWDAAQDRHRHARRGHRPGFDGAAMTEHDQDDEDTETGPPAHLGGLAGMDLVAAHASRRRAARGADPGQGRRPWPAVSPGPSPGGRRQPAPLVGNPAPGTRGDPQLLGSVTRDLCAQQPRLVGPSCRGFLYSARWPVVVGEQIAAHATPRSLNDGVLTVSARIKRRGLQQLRMVQAQLLAKIAAAVRGRCGEHVEDRRTRRAPSWRKGAYHIAGRGPRDTYG